MDSTTDKPTILKSPSVAMATDTSASCTPIPACIEHCHASGKRLQLAGATMPMNAPDAKKRRKKTNVYPSALPRLPDRNTSTIEDIARWSTLSARYTVSAPPAAVPWPDETRIPPLSNGMATIQYPTITHLHIRASNFIHLQPRGWRASRNGRTRGGLTVVQGPEVGQPPAEVDLSHNAFGLSSGFHAPYARTTVDLVSFEVR